MPQASYRLRQLSPQASVLVPVWNEAAVVGECIADIAAQVGVDFECVLVLDGPTDGTREVVCEAVAGDARFRVLDLPHAGLVAALNAGLAACRAPIVTRMDADDRMRPDRLVTQVRALHDAALGVVTCEVAYAVLGEGPAQAGMQRHVAWLNGLRTATALRNARFIDAPVAHPAVAYRTAIVRTAGGYRDGDFAEDHDLWLRLFGEGVAFGFATGDVPGALVTWRDHPERATRADGRYGDEPRRALVHRHLVAGPLAGRAVRIWGAGRYGRWHAKHLLAAGVAISAFIDIDPRKVGNRLFGSIPVVAADGLAAPDAQVTLVAVASPGARAVIASELARRGHVEGEHWLALQ